MTIQTKEAAGRVACYGVAHESCMGRTHTESAWDGLAPFDFDHRRILASSAFRRLQYKTQVLVSPRGDHVRTRLTHTLEVASFARLLAQALEVNVSLAEVAALAHDLGHAPFGHAGEAALNYLMREHHGFEHNAQSLRVVEYLEHPFPPFRGLNLTYELREALAKHRTAYDRPAEIESEDPVLTRLLASGPQPTIEGQLVAVADRVAYDCHDLEDALGAELLDGARLEQVTLWNEAAAEVKLRYPNQSMFAIWRPVIETIQQRLLSDAIRATLAHIEDWHIDSPDQAREHSSPVVSFSKQMEERVSQLEEFLRENVYNHPTLRRMDDMASRTIAELFNVYVEHPNHLPQRYYDRIDQQGTHRVACDYVAGMTDRFCEGEYKRIFMPFSM
ncbi:MAG: dNTP triphosphohydrolase [Planctomycetes bacterium]|nr:dNTP triphosphohydrolase [Planctomycetota bacterium]